MLGKAVLLAAMAVLTAACGSQSTVATTTNTPTARIVIRVFLSQQATKAQSDRLLMQLEGVPSVLRVAYEATPTPDDSLPPLPTDLLPVTIDVECAGLGALMQIRQVETQSGIVERDTGPSPRPKVSEYHLRVQPS